MDFITIKINLAHGLYGKFCNKLTKFHYLTFSLRVLPALNLTTFDAGILIFSPVRGLRPSRCGLATTLKVPKPTSVILSPPDKAAETAETNPSTALSACDLVIP